MGDEGLKRPFLLLPVPLNQTLHGIVYLPGVLLSEAGGDDLRGPLVLHPETLGDFIEHLGDVFDVVEQGGTGHVFGAHFEES